MQRSEWLHAARSRFEVVDTVTGAAAAVWVDVVKVGSDIFQAGRKYEATADVVGSLVQNFTRLRAEGYRLGISRQHEDDGYVYGEVHDLRYDSSREGTYLQALTSFADPKDRQAYNLGKIRHFSPGIDWAMQHPHTGEQMGPTLFHLAFVSEPQQKNLRYPQELNPGVQLGAHHEEDTMTTRADFAALSRLSDQLAAKLEAQAEELASLRELQARINAALDPDAPVAEEEAPMEEPMEAAEDGEEEEVDAMMAAPPTPVAPATAAPMAASADHVTITTMAKRIRDLEDAAVNRELDGYELNDEERAAYFAVGRDNIDRMRLLLSGRTTRASVQQAPLGTGTDGSVVSMPTTGKAASLWAKALGKPLEEGKNEVASADRTERILAVFKAYPDDPETCELLTQWDSARRELGRNPKRAPELIARMRNIENQLP